MAYHYDIEYRNTDEHKKNADFCSRLVDSSSDDELGVEAQINYFSHVDHLPITADDISRETHRDETLSRV